MDLTSADSVAWSKCSAADDSALDTREPAPTDDVHDLAQFQNFIQLNFNQTLGTIEAFHTYDAFVYRS